MDKSDFNETKCPKCGQRVPLNNKGEIVRHYEKIKAAYGRKGGQRLCTGSGMGAR